VKAFLKECGVVALALGRLALAIPAALLPHRLWPEIEKVAPVQALATASALTTLGCGFLLGAHGFLNYAKEETARSMKFFMKRPDLPFLAPLASSVDLLLFAFTTPLGLVSTYVFLTGLYRSILSAVDDPRGDPLLTLLWSWGLERARRTRESRAREERERREGPEVADLLLTGENAGVEGADYVVVASRRKPGWEPGVFVVTEEAWFRLGEPFDKDVPEGLRTFYPLTRLRDVEAARRRVPYRLPPLADALDGPRRRARGHTSS
jgi:hypothetical protein